MEFDQSYNGGPVDWNFPSPNATPTHNSFGSNTIQTPKTSTFPTHFQDAFTTPQFPSYTTPQQPQHPSMTPLQRPQTSSDTLRSNYYANIYVAGNQSHGQSMLPPGQREGSIPVVSPTYGNAYTAGMQQPLSHSFDSAQMQTPPPTRGTSAKRIQQPQQIAFGTPSTIASRRFMTPQLPTVPVSSAMYGQHTPVQFPQLQFSPEMYQFANLGPASAPVMPQSRILWDHGTSPLQSMPQPSLEDPFAPVMTPAMTWNSPPLPQGTSPSAVFDTPAMNGFAVHSGPQRRVPARTMSATHEPPNRNELVSTSVDPSLLYSSPLPPLVRTTSKPTKSRVPSTTQEKTKKLPTNESHNRPEAAASADATATTRPASNLHRSNTTGILRPKNALMSLSAAESSRSSSVNPILRTASPAKRFGRPPLGSISEGKPRHRPSVVLTVDENGIARTETKRVDDSPTRSMRERYPALFDSDSSDAETDTSERIPSRPSSFIFDKRDERRPKAAKLDPPIENLEGLSLPRSNSAASMKKGIPPSRAAVAAAAQLRRHGSLRRSTPSRNSRINPASRSTSSLIDTCPMDMPNEPVEQPTIPSHSDPNQNWIGDNDSLTVPSSSAETTLDMYNRRWSMMSFEQHQQHPPAPPALSPQQFYPPAFVADNTMYHPSPLQIRCMCGVPHDNGLQLIQCTSCTQWLHTACVGLDGQIAPPTFTCFLCTRPPPRPRNNNPTASSVQ